MSNGIMPYLANVDQIDSLFGRDDLRSKFISDNYSLVDRKDTELFTYDRECDDEEELTFFGAVSDYFRGQLNFVDEGWVYWYVYELLVKAKYGDIMTNDEWYPADVRNLTMLKSLKIFSLGHKTLPNPDDYPIVYVCNNDSLDEFHKEIKHEISDIKQRRQAQDWILKAKDKGTDLVLFNY